MNLARQLRDPRSILSLYRRLLAYRRRHPALQEGEYLPVSAGSPACYVYLRRFAGERSVLIALNFSSQEQQLDLSRLGIGNLVISTHLDREQHLPLEQLHLRADEGVIIELER